MRSSRTLYFFDFASVPRSRPTAVSSGGPYRWPFYYKKRANVEFRLPSVRAFGSPVRAGLPAANQALQHFAAEAVETTAIDGKYGKDRTPKCGDRKVLGE